MDDYSTEATEPRRRPQQYRAPQDDHNHGYAVRDDIGARRRRGHGGVSAAIGETDVLLYRSYAIVERLREAVAARHRGGPHAL